MVVMIRKLFYCIPLILTSFACLANNLPQEIKGIINASQFKSAHWGILVKELGTGKIIYQLNKDKMFIPASNTKLFTVATAMHYLGTNYRFKTPIYYRGRITKNGTLNGDLIFTF